MTPDEFQKRILPPIFSAWEERCFCRNHSFLKLVSFDFEDYGIGPLALMDSEIVIQAIIGRRFLREGTPSYKQGSSAQVYCCPKCGARCRLTYEDYSISMWRSFVLFEAAPEKAASGLYLVGFHGFTVANVPRIHDFRQASDEAEFLSTLACE